MQNCVNYCCWVSESLLVVSLLLLHRPRLGAKHAALWAFYVSWCELLLGAGVSGVSGVRCQEACRLQ